MISLFFKDAGIAFQDERYKYDDTWAATSKELQTRGLTKTGKVPVLEYNGEILTQVNSHLYLQLCRISLIYYQHISILRFLSRELGSYDGETTLDKHLVDTVADIYNDWRVKFSSLSGLLLWLM